MGLGQRVACGLMACSVLALAACQTSEPSKTSAPVAPNAFETGSLRALVIGESLPMVARSGDSFDGLSFVVLEAIRDQMKTAPEATAASYSIDPVAVSSAQEGLEKLRRGEADLACGVAFSWERQRSFDFTIPFASGGVRVLAPDSINGTPDSLAGQTIGVVQNSVAAEVLAESIANAQFQSFATPAEALAAFSSGEITRAANPFQAIKDGGILTMRDGLCFHEAIGLHKVVGERPACGVFDVKVELEHDRFGDWCLVGLDGI